MLGWIANFFLIVGVWYVGDKHRSAFLSIAIGELIWVGVAAHRQQWDLFCIACIFCGLAVRNYVKWEP